MSTQGTSTNLKITGMKERRRLPRSAAGGRVLATVTRSTGDVAVVGVQLVDSSAAGLGLYSPVFVEPGDLVGLHFDGSALPSRLGRVVRCEPHGEGYRVGLAAARRVAA
jgi:hypothetical protein